MCIKHGITKRLYLVMNFPIYKQPSILCVVKQYPLYRQIYEDTKNRELTENELYVLGLKQSINPTTVRLIEVEIPFEKLF